MRRRIGPGLAVAGFAVRIPGERQRAQVRGPLPVEIALHEDREPSPRRPPVRGRKAVNCASGLDGFFFDTSNMEGWPRCPVFPWIAPGGRRSGLVRACGSQCRVGKKRGQERRSSAVRLAARKGRGAPARGRGVSANDAFGRILGLLHEAAPDDARRPAASAPIEEAVGARGNVLTVGERSGDEVRVFFNRLLCRGEDRRDLAREYFEVCQPIDEGPPRLRGLPDSHIAPDAPSRPLPAHPE